MPDGWQWDETLYSGSARYYQRGRLPYAPGLPGLLAEVLALDGQGRLLDVGTGPGTLALSLAPLFAEIVGVDPDGGMIGEAERRAAALGLTGKARWVRARAEDLPMDLGSFTVATFGQSFHWMDRELVAATVHEMLRPAGTLAHITDLKGETLSGAGLPHPLPPYGAIKDLIRQYLGAVRRAGQGMLPHGTPGDEATVLARAGFAGPERYVAAGGQALERSCDDILAWVYSRSDSAPHLFGGKREDFEDDLTRLLHGVSTAGRFAERQPSTEVFVWHVASRGAAG